METSITVEPWPLYGDNGAGPTWNVKVAGRKSSFDLRWSQRLGRFTKSWGSMHLRRSEPTLHRAAVEFMQAFCSQSREVQP